ncbi:phosphatase PAP2 family protein [Thiolapillus sp.]
MTKAASGERRECTVRGRRQWLGAMLLVLTLLLPAFLLSPAIPRDDWPLVLWWSLSLSASKYGLVWAALLFSLLFTQSAGKLLRLLLPLLLIAGSGAWVNEHLIKPAVAQPRPNIQFMASAAAGFAIPEGVDAFYALPDKASRSQRLKAVWQDGSLSMPKLLRDHWTEETGFSFPSGHAFAATVLVAWLSLWVVCARRRLWLLPLLWGWMLAVCYSRIELGVHRPEDILAGAVEGLLLVMLSQWLFRRWLYNSA